MKCLRLNTIRLWTVIMSNSDSIYEQFFDNIFYSRDFFVEKTNINKKEIRPLSPKHLNDIRVENEHVDLLVDLRWGGTPG